ncbi:SDR family oxidoreductase [Dasania sp. GY-MA-18]|uniref:SDR family NAD(P)-dependent oxidoreductase n=1 Tax=Dasania phycosphaerae TaxID=2950436 RepID=A0A9J6RIG1_9GAMM|nr:MULTISPECIES: SDR family oxidoreductase [Dasania]MCR8921620.1 SDR family oxidoreductase [Dasania sp. GY-MA-18]MCZ0864048.1 SDR family NAD(P)-dependent oxidoreductase [Dasania phycosphaerae]MCZ0867776.1 SDR family NAD(P)-dependent oxidoreductase [Dasania phycosphaerae]
MNTQRLAGKVAIITGGGTGIGAAITQRFTQAGAKVLITGRRLQPLQEIAQQTGCEIMTCDVSLMDDCQAAVDKALALFGGLDILVSNAGVLYGGDSTEQDLAQWQQTFDINVTGVMQMARAAIPAMQQRPASAIVNIASVAALSSGQGMCSYVSSKTAVIGLTRSLAVDCGAYNIRANTLCPGWVKTPMSNEEMAELARLKNISVEAATHETLRHLPLQRMAEPAEIAACAEFLASDDASFITGTTLIADGGGSAVDVGTLSFNA